MKAKVHVCGREVDVDDVEIVDFEEEVCGRDLITFMYLGQEFKSYVVFSNT